MTFKYGKRFRYAPSFNNNFADQLSTPKCLRNLRVAPILELPSFGIVLLQNKQ